MRGSKDFQHTTSPHVTAHHGATLHDATQHPFSSTPQRSTPQHSTALHSTTQHNIPSQAKATNTKNRNMKKATVTLTSASPYSQSRQYAPDVPKLEKESNADYDSRNWREHQHYDRKTGEVFIPPMALKNALMECAQYLGEKIPGKGNATWTKHFTAGILVTDPIRLGVKKDETEGETFSCHADGKRGSGTRVPRKFPVIHEWEAKAEFYILDETITKDVFERYLVEAGKFIGVGRFRPRNGGFYGRFHVGDDLTWEDC
jgi:hypothetical protein